MACALAADLLYLQFGGLPAAVVTRASDLTQLALAVMAAVACARAAWRSAGALRMFWGNLFLFAFLWSAAQLLWTLAADTGPPSRILPPWDILFLASAVPAVVALLCRPDRWADVRAGLFVDAALLTVAAFHVFAFFALGHWLAGDQRGYAEWLARIHTVKGLLVVATAIWAAVTADRARTLYAHVAGALALLHLGAMVSNAAMRAGLYHPGLLDLPWTAPFLWIAWLAVAGRFPRPRSNDGAEPRLARKPAGRGAHGGAGAGGAAAAPGRRPSPGRHPGDHAPARASHPGHHAGGRPAHHLPAGGPPDAGGVAGGGAGSGARRRGEGPRAGRGEIPRARAIDERGGLAAGSGHPPPDAS